MPISQYLKALREKIGNEILQIPSAAAIIRDERGHVLLVKSASADCWGLPAGAIDLGETPEEAVLREVFEETNLIVKIKSVAGVFGGKNFRYVYANGDEVEYFIVVFECEILRGELAARDGEISEIKYFAPGEMPDLAIPYPKTLFSKK
ncbi:MAG TPA: NUDIX domain-containing protein [Pyrinomonadaceae bacterium]|jgi:ADP-ribose pyrophosphatase YjhB (NUDIX family)